MEENCLAYEAYRLREEGRHDYSLETRRLLRFTTNIGNVGNADFRPFIPKSRWEWHGCHQHYHSMEVGGWRIERSEPNSAVCVFHLRCSPISTYSTWQPGRGWLKDIRPGT